MAFAPPSLVRFEHRSQISGLRNKTQRRYQPSRASYSTKASAENDVYDVITIGSGLGGLCTSALLSTYNLKTLTLESHSLPGGAAQAFKRRTPHGIITLEAGPHLFSGLQAPSENPLYHVLRAVDAELDVAKYDSWGVFLPDTYVRTTLKAGEPLFQDLLQVAGGPGAHTDMYNLTEALRPLGKAATLLPPAALRAGDIPGTLRVAARYALSLSSLAHLPSIPQLARPFDTLLDQHVSDKFVRNFMNLLCFLLAGVTAERIPIAEVAFMFREWIGEDSTLGTPVLQRPVGGASGIATALIKAIEKRSGVIRTSSHVRRVLIEDGRAVGVQLKSGRTFRARLAVISNVSSLDVNQLLTGEDIPESGLVTVPQNQGEMCASFMHLHVALELTNEIRSRLPADGLEPNYISVEDWDVGLEHPDNVVLISVPSAIDKTVCPAGHAVLHAYTPATEPFSMWRDLKEGSPEYEAYKKERSAVLWRAVNRIFGVDIAPHAYIKLVGTPLTHARFLRRTNGSYGPKIDARTPGLGIPFPGTGNYPRGFYRVGDGVFPGIGVPAVAGSAWIVANGLVSVREQLDLLAKIGM